MLERFFFLCEQWTLTENLRNPNENLLYLTISEPCSVGTHRSTDQTECVPCEEGTYRDSTLTTCTKCPVNLIAEQTGAASCISCPAGTVSNDQRTQCGNAKSRSNF